MIESKPFPNDLGSKDPNLCAVYFPLMQLYERGEEIAPRGQRTRELRDFQYTLPPRVRFMNFTHRKLKLDYVKEEFLWYLRGDRYDVSIAKAASMWGGLINEDGSINSNYGYHLFNPQAVPPGSQHHSNFTRVVSELIRDPDSRRAAITILGNDVLHTTTKDYPCTCYLNFHVRQNRLHMYIRMRSQDAIYGFGNDAPFFSFVHELLWENLRWSLPGLSLGNYYHTSDSFHVYERHYEMLEKIITDPVPDRPFDFSPPAMGMAPEVKPPFDNQFYQEIRAGAFHAHSLMEKFAGGAVKLNTPFLEWLLTRDDPASVLKAEYKKS